MITLAIDTSTDTASIALLNNEEILCETFLNMGMQHSIFLLPAINTLYASTGIAPADTDLFACTIGPGAFTGLRVGVSTVKGLALATDKPVVGISTLEALAHNITDSRVDICPLLEAQNRRVYAARYRNREIDFPEVIEDEALRCIDDVLAGIERDTIFLGTGARKYADLIAMNLPGKGRMASRQHQYVRAVVVGFLGLRKFRTGDCLDIGTFTPRYLQRSYAQKPENDGYES